MKVKCIDAGNNQGTGDNLLTKDKIYEVIYSYGGYHVIMCDDGKRYSKLTTRFVVVK